MNNYCGPISAANLWVRLEKWKVSAVKTTEDDPLLVEMYVECVKLQRVRFNINSPTSRL